MRQWRAWQAGELTASSALITTFSRAAVHVGRAGRPRCRYGGQPHARHATRGCTAAPIASRQAGRAESAASTSAPAPCTADPATTATTVSNNTNITSGRCARVPGLCTRLHPHSSLYEEREQALHVELPAPPPTARAFCRHSGSHCCLRRQAATVSQSGHRRNAKTPKRRGCPGHVRHKGVHKPGNHYALWRLGRFPSSCALAALLLLHLLTRRARTGLGTATQCTRRNDSPRSRRAAAGADPESLHRTGVHAHTLHTRKQTWQEAPISMRCACNVDGCNALRNPSSSVSSSARAARCVAPPSPRRGACTILNGCMAPPPRPPPPPGTPGGSGGVLYPQQQ
jgi:hypothetical protein